MSYFNHLINHETMKRSKFHIPLFLTIAALPFSCAENEPQADPTIGLVKITEGYALGAGAKVELWAKEALFTGYNQLFVALKDSVNNNLIVEADVNFHPLMTMMGGMQHGCPEEDPQHDAVNKLFPGAMVFIMPTSDMGTWELAIDVVNEQNGKSGVAEFEIIVTDPPSPMLKSFLTPEEDKYFMSYLFPESPKVGVNDFTVVANEMASMMDFPGVEDLTIVLTPEMPSMGHGSPNNVNPVHEEAGHYNGKVNFTMTGDWRLNLEVWKGEVLLKELYFDVTIE